MTEVKAELIAPPEPLAVPEVVTSMSVEYLRHAAYTAPGGPDSIYMKWQRGEATEQDWLDAVQRVREMHPGG